jgi:hypothetical protein
VRILLLSTSRRISQTTVSFRCASRRRSPCAPRTAIAGRARRRQSAALARPARLVVAGRLSRAPRRAAGCRGAARRRLRQHVLRAVDGRHVARQHARVRAGLGHHGRLRRDVRHAHAGRRRRHRRLAARAHRPRRLEPRARQLARRRRRAARRRPRARPLRQGAPPVLARVVIVAVPLKQLQAGAIRFAPPLEPRKRPPLRACRSTRRAR